MKINDDIDFYQIDSLLTAEEKALKSKVRRFVDKECMPLVVEHFDKGAFPMAIIPRLAEQNFFGVHVDGYGCRPQSHVVYGLICQELGRCDSGLRNVLGAKLSGHVSHLRLWLRSAASKVVAANG